MLVHRAKLGFTSQGQVLTPEVLARHRVPRVAIACHAHGVCSSRAMGQSVCPAQGRLLALALALSGLVGPSGAAVLHEQGAIFLDSAPYGLLACAFLGLQLPMPAFADARAVRT